jgi:hypothetical protein
MKKVTQHDILTWHESIKKEKLVDSILIKKPEILSLYRENLIFQSNNFLYVDFVTTTLYDTSLILYSQQSVVAGKKLHSLCKWK